MGLVSESQINIADIIVALSTHETLIPFLLAVIFSSQVGIRPCITCLQTLGVHKSYVYKGITEFAKMHKIAVHPVLIRREMKFTAVKKTQDIYNTLLEKQINGVSLAFGKGHEMELAAFL
jgi:hypothetical protein